jgi:putative transposon-encoded protein
MKIKVKEIKNKTSEEIEAIFNRKIEEQTNGNRAGVEKQQR